MRKRMGIIYIALVNMLILTLTGCAVYLPNSNDRTSDVEYTEGSETSDTTMAEEITQPETPADVVVCRKEYKYDIETIDLSETDFENVDELIAELSALEYLKKIDFKEKELVIDDCIKLKESLPDIDFFWKIQLFEDIYIDSTMTKLDISSHKVEDAEYFSKIVGLFPNLTYIDMCKCGLTNEQMEVLRDTHTNVKFVWEITFGTWTIRTDRVAFSTLKGKTESYYLKSEDVECLKYCTDMVALDLGHNSIGDVSFLKYMPNLKILILVDNLNPETGKYITDLSVLEYCPKLEYLEFFVGNVSDLSFLEHLPNLKDLNLSYNPVKDVTYLLDLPSIERLFFEHTYLTVDDYKLLQETYPNAQVVMYGEGSVDNGWREHPRYFAMKDMYYKDYVHELFAD